MLPLQALLDAKRAQIQAIAARHGVRSIAVFGSVARGTEEPASDVDFLVEFESGVRPFELLVLGAELEDALGVAVDITNVELLRESVRTTVLAEALPLWTARRAA